MAKKVRKVRVNKMEKMVFGLIDWMGKDTHHINSFGAGGTHIDGIRSLEVFAKANGLKRPKDYEDIVMPGYDY